MAAEVRMVAGVHGGNAPELAGQLMIVRALALPAKCYPGELILVQSSTTPPPPPNLNVGMFPLHEAEVNQDTFCMFCVFKFTIERINGSLLVHVTFFLSLSHTDAIMRRI